MKMCSIEFFRCGHDARILTDLALQRMRRVEVSFDNCAAQSCMLSGLWCDKPLMAGSPYTRLKQKPRKIERT